MKTLKALSLAMLVSVPNPGFAEEGTDDQTGITENGYVYKQAFMPRQTLEMDLSKTALLVIDPQNDFMSEHSPIWPLVGPVVERNNLVSNLQQLIATAKDHDMFVFYSPHMYTQNDIKQWKSLNGIDKIMFEQKMFIEGTKGHEYLPALAPTDDTILLSPHKGLSNFWSGDIAIQMRQRGIETVIITGMAANMCVDAHSRDAIENGFDVVLVADAVAAAGDLAMEAALINYEFLGHEVLTTKQLIGRLQKRGAE